MDRAELQMRYASMLQTRKSSFRAAHLVWEGLASVVALALPSFLPCLGVPFAVASEPLCFPRMQCFRLGHSSPMDWQSLAMKRTELRRAGLRSGGAESSSERMEDRMRRTQARQPSRKASSTAGESVKRLKEDADALSLGPEGGAETELDPTECSMTGDC